ncbi:MAG: V-type ATP synthase subunit D [Clostridiales bacterium]|jgi:V/A-type H+-transporting ATPase subunit D|nr:V-type ATP synthase subunit D [Clostridiales bacterium]
MERLNVNPTRMELTRLKKRYNVARRGHRLLKDKRDGLMKNFLEIVRKNREFRIEAEAELAEVYKSFHKAKDEIGERNIKRALMLPNFQARINVEISNVMSVNAPTFTLMKEYKNVDYPYGFYGTTIHLDNSVSYLDDLLPKLLELAQYEKTAQMLAIEIEKVRRRVNALEHFLIPQLEETIKYIAMKLDENERGNLVRLMKVKEMIYTSKLE